MGEKLAVFEGAEERRLGLEAIGANMVGGPRIWPEHGEEYYAVFFKDPDGIKYEVVHVPRPEMTREPTER